MKVCRNVEWYAYEFHKNIFSRFYLLEKVILYPLIYYNYCYCYLLIVIVLSITRQFPSYSLNKIIYIILNISIYLIYFSFVPQFHLNISYTFYVYYIYIYILCYFLLLFITALITPSLSLIFLWYLFNLVHCLMLYCTSLY